MTSKLFSAAVFAMAALVAMAAPVQAQDAPKDKLTTADGSVLNGNFSGVSGGKVGFTESAAGQILFDPAKVRSLDLAGPRRVWYQPKRSSLLSQGVIRGGTGGPDGFKFDASPEGGEPFDPLSTYKLAMEEYSLWNFTGFLGASASYSDGNTEQLNYGLNSNLKLEHPLHVWDFNASAAFGESDRVRNTQRARAELSYTWRFSEVVGLFGRQLFEHDHFAALRVRSTTTVGGKGFIVDGETVTWTADLGVSYISEHYKNGDPNREYTAGAWGTDVVYRHGPMTTFLAGVNGTVSLEDSDVAMAKAYAQMNTVLMAGLTASLRFEWDWVGQPSTGSERLDTRVILSLGWTFA